MAAALEAIVTELAPEVFETPVKWRVKLEMCDGKLVSCRAWQLRGWRGRQKLVEARHAKGAAASREVGAAAITLALKYQNGNDHIRRQALLGLLIREYVDPKAAALPGAHPDYRRARATVMRRLHRAYRELGEPPELRDLL